MIFIGFALRNPWSNRFKVIAERAIDITTNKTFEIGLSKNSSLIEFGFGITSFKQDHAGFNFDIGLFGYHFEITFYDNRHYDQRKGQ